MLCAHGMAQCVSVCLFVHQNEGLSTDKEGGNACGLIVSPLGTPSTGQKNSPLTNYSIFVTVLVMKFLFIFFR